MKVNFLKNLGGDFHIWSNKQKVNRIPKDVAREGAGENRIPFAHLANSVPVYLTLTNLLINDVKRSLSILDVGCGAGKNVVFVKDRVNQKGHKYFGIDYSEACINFAKKLYGDTGIVFKSHDGKVMPFTDKSFDYVVSSHVLEHIPKSDVNIYFSEISRILKDNGTAIIGTPNRKYCQDLFNPNPEDKPELRLILPHLHEYYYTELKGLLSKGDWFNSFDIDQTANPINRELMIRSINQIKPRNSVLGKIIFRLYSVLRKSSRLQDLMARRGTELILKLMGASYFDLLDKTVYLEDDGSDEGDNFIVIAKK